MTQKYEHYYVPAQSHWPIVGCLALAALAIGAVGLFHKHTYGGYVFLFGALCMAYMMYGWFGNVIHESAQGLYSKQMDKSFRWGMGWFIFSEVMFFAAFFGALFYARMLAVPWLAGEGDKVSTAMLWEHFKNAWPLLSNPSAEIIGPKEGMSWKPWPAINTAILLTSSVTVTWAHHALLKKHRASLCFWLFLTVALGASFLSLQAYEYYEAYHVMGLTLNSGIYGTTFFMLTGFHGAHVTIGSIMLSVMLMRSLKGHFTPENHFGFEATAWYWHFVDVVWLFLFIFVYIL